MKDFNVEIYMTTHHRDEERIGIDIIFSFSFLSWKLGSK